MNGSPLARLLTSGTRAKLLQFFAIFNEDRVWFRDIQRRIGVGSRSLQRELKCLESLGLIEKQGTGRDARYRARTEAPAWLPVWETVRTLARPEDVLKIVFADLH